MNMDGGGACGIISNRGCSCAIPLEKAAEVVAAVAIGPAAAVEMYYQGVSFGAHPPHAQNLHTDNMHQFAALCVQLTNATLYTAGGCGPVTR